MLTSLFRKIYYVVETYGKLPSPLQSTPPAGKVVWEITNFLASEAYVKDPSIFDPAAEFIVETAPYGSVLTISRFVSSFI
jgi:hypothetical protein